MEISGDPIISKDTLEIYQYLREVNPNISLAMHTNGSAREPAWWEKIAKAKVKVTFGLDGLQDTNHYIGYSTNFDKIIKNAKAFIDAGGFAKWHMLVFEHNEHPSGRSTTDGATSQDLKRLRQNT